MNAKTKKHLTLILAATLPLIIVTGCASNNQKVASTEPDTNTTSAQTTNHEPTNDTQQNVIQHPPYDIIEEHQITPAEDAVALAIANMNSYVKQLEEEKGTAENSIIEAPSEIEIAENVTTKEITAEQSAVDVTQMSDEALLVAEVLGTTVDVISEAYESRGKTVLPPPQQMVFHFSSGKNELDESNHETVKTHAKYLLEHPNYILVVSGHADNQGSKKNNQRLSELRAQHVAELLKAEGINESQLRVSGMGDVIPMVSPDNWDENRRVEFVYQDTMMATAR